MSMMTGDNHGGSGNNNNNNSTTSSLCPTNDDIRRHPGNIWFRSFLHNYQDRYHGSTKVVKTALLKRIMEEIHGTGRRFYVMDDNDNNNWHVVEEDFTNHIGGGNRNVISRKISRLLNRKKGKGSSRAHISNLSGSQSASTPEINQPHSYNLRSRRPHTQQPHISKPSRNAAKQCVDDEPTCWIDDDFLANNKGIIDDVWSTLRDIYCHPFRHPNASGNQGIVLTADSPRGNPATVNIVRNSYLRQHFVQLQREMRSSRKSKETTCYPYAVGSGMGFTGYGSVGTPPSQMVYRPWTDAIQRIADCVYNHVQSKLGGVPGINVSSPFNSMTLLSFRGKQVVPPHRDNLYDSEGNFMANKNSQKEDTGTFILVLGDPRIIKFQLTRKKKGHVTHYLAQQTHVLKHGALFMLNPMCERPAIRAFFDELEMSYWEHGQKVPSLLDRENGMGFGMAFRVCVVPRQINAETGSLVLTERERKWDAQCFHDNNKLLENFISDKMCSAMAEEMYESFHSMYECHRQYKK